MLKHFNILVRPLSTQMTVDTFFSEVVASNGVFKSFKDGEWFESSSGKTVKVLNPSTNAPVYEVQGMLWVWMGRALLASLQIFRASARIKHVLWPLVSGFLNVARMAESSVPLPWHHAT